MVADGRYVADETKFKQDAYSALSSRFTNRDEFENFYSSLTNMATKDNFLRAASFYLFMVKCGDWHVAVDRSNPVIGYFTNSYKLVALFSIIESLSNKQYKDFYGWLNEFQDSIFPISNQAELSALNDSYKVVYGSIRRCKDFFEGLPQCSQEALCNAIRIDGQPLTSVKKVAEFLYEKRSKFVHDAQLLSQIRDDNATVLSMKGNKVVQTELSIESLLQAFEEGLLVYFGRNSLQSATQ
jgi:hypothetical protein